jgi:excisionase family DNA binding protein
VADEISVSQAAGLLGTSGQTVRNYLRRGLISARRTGRRFLVDRSSVEALLRQGGRGSRRRGRNRRSRVPCPTAQALARERDDLRARVVELQEAVLRLRSAADLQRQADAARRTEIEHLLEALREAERTDELRRRAAAELEEALAGMALPGHLGRDQRPLRRLMLRRLESCERRSGSLGVLRVHPPARNK